MKASKETIIRTIVLIIALANQILATFGKGTIEITEEEIYQLVSIVATVAVSIWTWWKNNSFTASAIKADEILAKLKKDEEV